MASHLPDRLPGPEGPVTGEPRPLRGISVVVPTLGHPESVRRLLESLRTAAGLLPEGHDAEVIVVDDSSDQDLRGIRQACAETGASYVRGPRRVGAKRNLGAARAKHPLVLFIDSDCVATPSLLLEHLRAHNEEQAPSGRPVAAVAGPTVVEGVDEAAAWRTVKDSVVVNAPWNWPQHYRELWWAATSNLSVRTEALDDIGGFDELTYTVVGGEDVDLGVRLHEAGWATVGHPSAVVRHATDGIDRLGQFRRKLFLYGRACVYNCVRQPQFARWWPNPVTAAALGAGAAVLLPGRSRTAALATTAAGTAAWYAADTRRTARRSGAGWRSAAAATSVDWSYHLGIVREALRRGRPLLAAKRFDYFRADRFAPAPPASTTPSAPSTADAPAPAGPAEERKTV
ncbi:glycosyltransferase family 2 protein [Streptomyces sp. CA2R106]|uniref:glycosyltransferase family 2 protein n=1 Tax=Streptomyces sp. CA2R106 TaxID=3120153 RepID=UPI003007FA33